MAKIGPTFQYQKKSTIVWFCNGVSAAIAAGIFNITCNKLYKRFPLHFYRYNIYQYQGISNHSIFSGISFVSFDAVGFKHHRIIYNGVS